MTSTTTGVPPAPAGADRTTTAPGLVFEFGYEVALGAPLEVGAGPFGVRMVAPVLGGPVAGDRISGEVLGPAGDWILFGPDGWATLDIRGQIRTTDGALLYYRSEGHMEVNEAVQRYVAGEASTDFGDHYARIAFRMETGSEQYAWVNRTLFVGEIRMLVQGEGRAVGVRVHRVT